MGKDTHAFSYIAKSKFLRSVFLQVVSVFVFVIIAVAAITFFSFTTEINKSVISDRQEQLSAINENISKRMEEVSSVAYSVSHDKTFYLEPIDGTKYSGYEMSTMLERYLVGNDFIEHLAYYRLSEPDRIYTSHGELSFSNYCDAYLSFGSITKDEYLELIKSNKNAGVVALTNNDNNTEYVMYTCALPQLSADPQAYVIMMIPYSEVKPILDVQLTNCFGEVMVFDSVGNKVCVESTVDDDTVIDDTVIDDTEILACNNGDYITVNGSKYVVLSEISETNGWTYVSVIRLNDILSELVNKQLVFILLLVVLMIAAVFVVLLGITSKYKPISNLAQTMTDEDSGNGVIDEKNLLSQTFETLRDDSEQKQRFETAYYEAEAASKAKSEFLSNMSHDIRTPMNAIVGMTEIALRHSDEPECVKECLKKIKIASQYLLDIINNVLDMSRIESGKFTLTEEVIELPIFIYGIITIINQNAEAKRQHFIVETDGIENERVIGDSVRLAQVFINILSNAVKFTPNDGTIMLRIAQMKSNRDGYGDFEFTFTDTGIGMPSEFVEQVFDTFSRANRTDVSKIEGTGLGMAIAKNLVERMGGEITCESKEGEGTIFVVRVNLKLEDDNMEQKINECAKMHRGKSVLICGSEESTCLCSKKLFERFGLIAEYVLDIQKACEAVRKAAQKNKAFDYIIIAQNGNDSAMLKKAVALSCDFSGDTTCCVLAAQDYIGVDRVAAEQIGVSGFVRLPMFVGTVISILDRKYERPNDHASNTDSIVDLTGRRILVVEDNLMNREIARRIISETNAEIFEAVNGKEAVDMFASHKEWFFDVILMDVQMPVMNGYEAARTIRAMQREDAATIPIFALTANTFDEDVQMVKEAGMNGHIGKPYAPDKLYEILNNSICVR